MEQDFGRGRQGRRWIGQEGNFFGSTLIILGPNDPPAPALSLASGLALIEAVDVAAPGRPLMLKWPNDLLLLADAKLAGILLERSGDRIVAGFGVNLASAPEIEGRRTTSLSGVIGPDAFAPLLAGSFARLLTAWRTSPPSDLARAWCARAHPVGTPITVHSGPGEKIGGLFDGIEPDGALRLRRPGGAVDIIHAGDVEL